MVQNRPFCGQSALFGRFFDKLLKYPCICFEREKCYVVFFYFSFPIYFQTHFKQNKNKARRKPEKGATFE